MEKKKKKKRGKLLEDMKTWPKLVISQNRPCCFGKGAL